MLRSIKAASLAALIMLTSGCAGQLRDFVVAQRNHQGDQALDRGNLKDAALGYRLALQLAPTDPHARAGLVDVLTELARREFEASDFESAVASLVQAQEYDPESVRVAQLRNEVEQAKVRRQLVVANYPTYKATGAQILQSFTLLDTQNKAIIAELHRFQFTYDSTHLTEAIKNAY